MTLFVKQHLNSLLHVGFLCICAQCCIIWCQVITIAGSLCNCTLFYSAMHAAVSSPNGSPGFNLTLHIYYGPKDSCIKPEEQKKERKNIGKK